MPVAGKVRVLVSNVHETALSRIVVLGSLRDAPRLPFEVDRNEKILLHSKVYSLESFCVPIRQVSVTYVCVNCIARFISTRDLPVNRLENTDLSVMW